MDIWDYLSLLSYGLLLASSFVSLVLIILGRDYRNSQESFWLENRPIDDWRSVTLAVPAYNEEKVIIQCLESIAKVEYQGLKVVVVDDGSPYRSRNYYRGRGTQNETNETRNAYI